MDIVIYNTHISNNSNDKLVTLKYTKMKFQISGPLVALRGESIPK